MMQPGGGGAFCDQAHNGRLELNLRRVRPELRNPNRTAASILTYSSGEPQGIGDALGPLYFPWRRGSRQLREEELARNRKCPTGSGPLSPQDLRLKGFRSITADPVAAFSPHGRAMSGAIRAPASLLQCSQNRTLPHGGGLERKVPRAKRTRIRKRFEIKLLFNLEREAPIRISLQW